MLNILTTDVRLDNKLEIKLFKTVQSFYGTNIGNIFDPSC